MRFDASLRDRWSRQGDGWQLEMPGGWMQGRSVFGGLTVACAAALARTQVDEARGLRSVHAQLLRPVVPGATAARFRILREGRNVTFTETRLSQHDQEVAVVSAVFGKPRDTPTRVAPSPAPEVPPADRLTPFPYIEGVMPEFTQHLSMRWASGGLPFSGAEQARFTGVCRFGVPSGDIEGVLGLLDAWPCPTLSMLSKPCFASTLHWTAHLLQLPPSLDDWFTFAYETVAGEDGFHTAVGQLHAPDGSLVGWTEQLVAVF